MKNITKQNKASLMPNNVILIIQLFAMKYNIDSPLIILENDRVMDLSNTVSMEKYCCYIFDCNDKMFSIHQETYHLEETILKKYDY